MQISRIPPSSDKCWTMTSFCPHIKIAFPFVNGQPYCSIYKTKLDKKGTLFILKCKQCKET